MEEWNKKQLVSVSGAKDEKIIRFKKFLLEKLHNLLHRCICRTRSEGVLARTPDDRVGHIIKTSYIHSAGNPVYGSRRRDFSLLGGKFSSENFPRL